MEVNSEDSLFLKNNRPGEMEKMEVDDQKEEPKKLEKILLVLNDDNPSPSKKRRLNDSHLKETIFGSVNMDIGELGGGNQLNKTDGSETARSSILKAGEGINTGERGVDRDENPFECSFSENTLSRSHEVRLPDQFHPKPLLQCPECGETFTRRTSWIWHHVVHIRKVSENKFE